MNYFYRIIESQLIEYLNIFPVVGIMGPRQAGKSTMLAHLLLDEYTYVTFDDDIIVSQFYADPKGFMAIYSDKVIFDEAQKVPEIFNYIKLAVDQDRSNTGKYIVSGSQQFSMQKNISDSLAGRIGLLTLLPLQYTEVPAALRDASQFQGGYPECVIKNYEYMRPWYSSYVSTYLERDVKQLANIGDLRTFRQLITLLASRVGQVIQYQSLATEIGVSIPTIKRWLSILEASYILFLLPPYYKNFGKRVVKNPKIYFYDVGLVSYLTGVYTEALYNNGPLAGQIFENYIITEIMKNNFNHNLDLNFYYFRDSNGLEVDLLVDHGQRLDFIEIKKSSTYVPKMLSAIKKLKSEQDQGYLLYRGQEVPEAAGLQVMNYQDFLQLSEG